ncbi:MAG: hypothetical protein EXS02_06090 [Planctomycetes bacterium]|nr:hypothetical protein [Planctomycetota bacterium]
MTVTHHALLRLFLPAVSLLAISTDVYGQLAPPHPASTLHLLESIPWQSDGSEFYDHAAEQRGAVDRTQLIDQVCAKAKAENKLVLWYVHRIEEAHLGGRQMYRSPILDTYLQQVVLSDGDVSAMATECFVPVRCMLDETLSQRFGLRPLAFVEPAIVFLDGDGNVIHFVERFRTFHAHWFASLMVRLLEQQQVPRKAVSPIAMRRMGLWRPAATLLIEQPRKSSSDWLLLAALQRLLRQPDAALLSLDRAASQLDSEVSSKSTTKADIACERGLVLTMVGRPQKAQPEFEYAWRNAGTRTAEAGYWFALNALHLGDEVGAMRRFELVALRHANDLFGKRAHANVTLGPDDRPIGAAFAGFEGVRYLPESAYQGMPKDTTWNGAALEPKAMARQALEFLLAQQHDDGGFTDARYAYWPSSEITPNVWVAITAIAMTALWEYRSVFPDLGVQIDLALQRGYAFAFDPKRLNRGANEDCYSDAYRLMYLARRSRDASVDDKQVWIARMNDLVEQARARQMASGFWAHEYENAFATGAILQEILAAKAGGASVPSELTDKGASALISARFKTGSFAYGGAAGTGNPTSHKDAVGRMPVCEGALLQLGRSDLDKLRFAMTNFFAFLKNLEGVRRNDFHSDGELGGFFFFHSVYHASEVVKLLPEAERAPHWQKFIALLQDIPEIDGSFIDSHELGRSYGTAMALLTLRNAAQFE